MKQSELAEWRSTFSPFGIDDPTITPMDVARRLERAETERDDLILKLTRLLGQQPDGGREKLFAIQARQRRLDARGGWNVWREVPCEKCRKSMLYNNGNELDLTCGDVAAIRCWHCGAITVFDNEVDAAELVEKTYPRPDHAETLAVPS